MDGRKSRERSCLRSVRLYFREYCNASSIHGFRYFGENRTYFERCWWFVVFAIVLSLLSIAIKEVYEKWLRSPVIVSFATRETPIYSIPFPAVTICPESKTLQDMYNHSKTIRRYIDEESYTEEEQLLMDYMGLICDPGFWPLNYSDTLAINDSEHFFDTLDMMKPADVFDYCQYMGDEKDCDAIFKPILTDEGICYSFNMLDKSEIFTDDVYYQPKYFQASNVSDDGWTPNDGYSEDAGIVTYPRRASVAGARYALVVHIHLAKDELDFNCKGGLQGFRVSLHTPMRIPRPSQHYFMVPMDEAVLAVIKPNMITTSATVQVFPSSKRECYFPTERKLKYFKIYTALNCKLECLTNYTLDHCKCVQYYMPRNQSTKICGIGSLPCIEKAERGMEMIELLKKLDNEGIDWNIGDTFKCDCKPLCSDLSYDVETSQGAWNWYDELKTYNSSLLQFNFDRDEHHMSKLVIFFKSSQFITSQRHELYGPTDFLANFGGLLGLFTGFSVLSFMEIIYFLTVRLCCNSRLYGYWAGQEVLKDEKIQLKENKC